MERGTTSVNDFQGVTYLRFAKGRFTETVDEKTEGAVSREIEKGENKGKKTWDLHHGSVTGKLLAVNTSVGKYGRVWAFKIDVSIPGKQKIYLFQTQASYPVGREVISRLLNADLTLDIKLQGYYIEKDNKEGVTIYQPALSKAKGQVVGELIKVEQFYSKDGANQLPKWKEVKLNGKTEWDKEDETQELIAAVEKHIKPLLQDQSPVVREAQQPTATSDAPTPTTFAADTSQELTDDDLPF